MSKKVKIKEYLTRGREAEAAELEGQIALQTRVFRSKGYSFKQAAGLAMAQFDRELSRFAPASSPSR